MKFVSAFSAKAQQAEEHLSSFRHVLATSTLLRQDYPNLVKPIRRGTKTVADTQSMYQAHSGFAFSAKGVDTAVHGQKVNNQRTDCLILDDIELDESSYSEYQAGRRLLTLTDTLLPLMSAECGYVELLGTTTMPHSICDQFTRSVTHPNEEPAEWIRAGNWEVHHHSPILTNEDGSEVSLWPEMWPIEWLREHRYERDFRKSMFNDPASSEEAYWKRTDFRYATLQAPTTTILSIDPAMTTKKTSDRTGIVVLSFSHSENLFEIKEAVGVRLVGQDLRQKVLQILSRHPETQRIVVESNVGGEYWREILHGMPAPVRTYWVHDKKEVRAAALLNRYHRKRVIHSPSAGLDQLEGEMVNFPGGNDDLVDATGGGVTYIASQLKRQAPSVRSVGWV